MTNEQGFISRYLSFYGYLPSGSTSGAVDPDTRSELMADAVRKFQLIAGLPATGEVDEPTLNKMQQPRCGLMDVHRSITAESAKWRKTNLTYFVEKRVTGLSAGDVDDLIALAWKDWTDVADFKIAPTLDRGADIIISTGSGRGDGFDGPSGTLAWAYLPNGTDGQLLCRFDLGETWLKDNPSGGILFRNVACHEFGHLLGLEHSRVSSALMAPFYSPSITGPRQSDDVPRIVALYGKAEAPPPDDPGVKSNVIRIHKNLTKGRHGDITLGADLLAGDYHDAVLMEEGGPPPVP